MRDRVTQAWSIVDCRFGPDHTDGVPWRVTWSSSQVVQTGCERRHLEYRRNTGRV